MKNIFLKTVLLLPLLFFVSYLLMMIIGCTAYFLGFNPTFYDCTYCSIGKVLGAISILVIIAAILPDIKLMFNKRLHSKSKLG